VDGGRQPRGNGFRRQLQDDEAMVCTGVHLVARSGDLEWCGCCALGEYRTVSRAAADGPLVADISTT
jgi:hypothetical protein